MSNLSFHTVQTGPNPVGTVIWLHGLGDDGFGHEPVVQELRLPENLSLRFILPHAPIMPVTINGGMMMPAWYDILNTEIEREIDEEGVKKSGDDILELIEAEVEAGMAVENIVIAGFSQGGAVAMEVFARENLPLKALICMSTYLGTWPEPLPSPESKGPVFIGHGNQDPVVPVELGSQAKDHWQEWGFDVEYKEYPMQHSLNQEEIADIRKFLVKVYS